MKLPHIVLKLAGAIVLLASCLPACDSPTPIPSPPESEGFPSGSVWRFELRYESTQSNPMSAQGGGCRESTEPACNCTGQQAYGDPIYTEIEEVFGGEFRVETELFDGYHRLIPLDVHATMRVNQRDSELTEICTSEYGDWGDTYGRHSVHAVFNAAQVLEWFGEDNALDDGQFSVDVSPPYDHWSLSEYTYSRGFNTVPGRVSPIGAWWSSDSWHLTGASSLWAEAPLENGQWVEEEGPYEFTDNGGFTYVSAHGVRTFSLQCIENCHNFDCSELCYDGKECTDDTCTKGKGCLFEPWGGPCRDDECYEVGICRDGECIQEVEEDCDDNDTCTKDSCHPMYGCTHDADNKKLRNEDPTDCWQEICLNGLAQTIPDPTETPPQASPNDCYRETCIAGYGVVSIPTNAETPPQNAPDDCLREVCMTGVGLTSVPDGTEPGCTCSQDWQCEDGNFCTRESCDPVTDSCVNHGPDDNLIPPEIPANCNDEQCQAGQMVLVPDDGDMPVDLDPYDCQQQYCDNGVIQTAPDEDEHIGCSE